MIHSCRPENRSRPAARGGRQASAYLKYYTWKPLASSNVAAEREIGYNVRRENRFSRKPGGKQMSETEQGRHGSFTVKQSQNGRKALQGFIFLKNFLYFLLYGVV